MSAAYGISQGLHGATALVSCSPNSSCNMLAVAKALANALLRASD